jgi:hypothetical protein
MNVWASAPDVPTGQTEIDDCRGAVDMTSAYFIATVAVENRCGGSSAPSAVGSLIHLTGIRAGTYRVDGTVYLNGNSATAADIPRGYDLIFQTCTSAGYSNMRFIELTKIG